MRVAVYDMGTNSTRLLVADVDPTDGSLTEIERHSRVTRMGRGVATSGKLSADAIEDVCAAIADYRQIAAAHCPDTSVAVATSAVRDADNGAAFIAELRERFSLTARTIDGEEEARLTWLGANAGRISDSKRLVFDIGGGSTELIIGVGADPRYHTSLQLGVVRQTERFINNDPPLASELDSLAESVVEMLDNVRFDAGTSPADAIAVAGTPTSLAAMELGLEPYDSDAIEGHRLSLQSIQQQMSRLSATTTEQRAELTGLLPERAPTIVCGVVILIGVMRCFGLQEVTVSEHDILWGSALTAAGAAGSSAGSPTIDGQ